MELMGKTGRMSDTKLDELVDRVAVLPGQLTSYDSGRLEIFALRKLERERLGDEFDFRVFHDKVLENRTVPLEMLRRHVGAWIVTELPQCFSATLPITAGLSMLMED